MARTPAPGAPGVSTQGLVLPVDLVANGYWYGDGCGGHAGQVVTITANPALRPGFDSTMRVVNLPQNTDALIMFGFSHVHYPDNDHLGCTINSYRRAARPMPGWVVCYPCA